LPHRIRDDAPYYNRAPHILARIARVGHTSFKQMPRLSYDPKPTASRRLAYVLRLAAGIVIVAAVWDLVWFRSGLYIAWLEPQSVAGATRAAQRVVDKTYIPGRRNVLVIGNSQIGEGFAPVLADSAVAGSDLHFVNGFIPGSDPRIWYYLLREVDPDSDRFAAVVLSVPYTSSEKLGTMADWSADIAYLAPLLRLSDIWTFPDSFDAPSLRSQARRAILFPAQPLRRDIADMLASPWQRYARVGDFERRPVSDFLKYAGRPNTLPDLPIDPQTGEPSSWTGVDDAEARKVIAGYLHWLHVPPATAVLESNERYYRDWLTRIAAPYRLHGIPVILMEAPRGPWHGSQAPVPAPSGSIATLIDSGLLVALPGDSFVDLEKPNYFFDTEHMNRAGRERFSPRLAQLVSALLH